MHQLEARPRADLHDTGQTNWIFTLFPYQALGEIQPRGPWGRPSHPDELRALRSATTQVGESRVWPRVFATTSSSLALICSTLCAVFVVSSI